MDERSNALAPLEPLVALPDEALSELSARAAAAGYRHELLVETERVAPRQLDAVRLPLVQAWLGRRGGPGSTLAGLFSYGTEVERGEVVTALGDQLVAALLGAHVLRAGPYGALSSRYRLTPLHGLLILSDPPEAGGEAVIGPGPTTMQLVDLIGPSPGDVLDVGCGAGTMALVAAARGARWAVGVDLSERAVAVARWNARLNGSRAEFRGGDLLAPVAGERFDLVLSQPPYVVLPPGLVATTYLHGGPLGEELALRFAAAFPAALLPGGLAILHFDAPALPGPPVVERLRAALGRAVADLVVLTAQGPSADLESAAYGALEDPSLGPGYRSAVARYRDHLAAAGVTAFTRVLALVRRPAAGPRGLTAQLPAALDRATPAALAHLLDGLDLAGAPEAELLSASVGPAPGARLVQEQPLTPGAEPSIRLRFAEGLASDLELTPASLALLEALAASPNVSAAIDAYARACGAGPQEVQAPALAAVRDGLARGAYARRVGG